MDRERLLAMASHGIINQPRRSIEGQGGGGPLSLALEPLLHLLNLVRVQVFQPAHLPLR